MPKTSLFTAIIHSKKDRSIVVLKFPENGIQLETTATEAMDLLVDNGYVAAGPSAYHDEHAVTVFTKVVEEHKVSREMPRLPAFKLNLQGLNALLEHISSPSKKVRTETNPNIERLILREVHDRPDFSRLGGSIFARFRDGSERKATIGEIANAYVVDKES